MMSSMSCMRAHDLQRAPTGRILATAHVESEDEGFSTSQNSERGPRALFLATSLEYVNTCIRRDLASRV
jgi:hypothetical protein